MNKVFTNKYKNKKTTINGIKFDSKLEAKRFTELKLLEKSGLIEDLKLQPSFELIPTFKKKLFEYKYPELTIKEVKK